MSRRLKKITDKSDVLCEGNVTSFEFGEDFQKLDPYKVDYLAELGERHDYPESRDSNYREWSKLSHKDETDYQEWDNVKKGALPHCESVSLSNESHEDQDDNSTDPFLVHELLVPYNRMPRPRLLYTGGKNAEQIAIELPRRPRSPIRQILPGRFDLSSRIEELLERQNTVKTRELMRESKDRILKSVKQILNVDINFDLIICMLLLRAMCEQAILTAAKTNTGTDICTFVNMVIMWALADLHILNPDTLEKQERDVWRKLGLFNIDTCLESHEVLRAVASSKLRNVLLEVHQPNFSSHILKQLHRCLPWTLVSPAHERGSVKFYPTVRDRIDEILANTSEQVKSVYVPNPTCFHLGGSR